MDEKRVAISVAHVETDETKTLIDIELADEFYDWFRKNHGTTNRWNDSEFKKWFRGVLCKAWITLEAGAYKVIYRAQPPYGSNTPKKGDVISFYTSGYRTRIVAEVTKKAIKLEPLWDGDSYGRINLSNITDIIRPRKRLSSTPPMYEPEEAGD